MILSRTLHVLLVEDNPINQKVASRLLEKEGHSVRIAGNGQEALEILEDRAFDVVLMDIQMPVMDGWQTTEAIRALETSKQQGTSRRTPIIALTAQTANEDQRRCFQVGMDGYVSKPIRPPVLFQTLAEVLYTLEPPQRSPGAPLPPRGTPVRSCGQGSNTQNGVGTRDDKFLFEM